MYSRILIPRRLDALRHCRRKGRCARQNSWGKGDSAHTVMEPFPRMLSIPPWYEATYDVPGEFTRGVNAEADRCLAEAEQHAKLVGVPCETVKVEHGQPYEAIIEAASAHGCDLIAMASHGRRGMSALILGSETMKVLPYSKLPVLVYR